MKAEIRNPKAEGRPKSEIREATGVGVFRVVCECQGSGPKPRRGDLFIATKPSITFFLFFGGAYRQQFEEGDSFGCPSGSSAVGKTTPPKNKKKLQFWRRISINRPPLRGFCRIDHLPFSIFHCP